MANVVINADAVGQIVTFVAPGFLAQLGYGARYPGPHRPAGETLIIAVVISLPLVALANAVLPGTQRATQVGYVLLLLGFALVLGYVASVVRGRPRSGAALARMGYRLQPEGTIYAQTLKHMTDTGTVLVELKDGRRVWGCPRSGPQSKDDGVNELYLVYPESPDENGEWHPVGPAAIIPLAEVNHIVLSEEPTGAPAAYLPRPK